MMKIMGLTALMLTMVIGTTSATLTHVVGGNIGWKHVENNPNFHEMWAQRRTFGVGDKLLFSYESSNTVLMVTKDDYEKCSQPKKPINSWTSGPTIINLSKPGDYCFIAGSKSHCQSGQKLHVRVVNGSGKPGPVDFDFHIIPARRELDEGEPNNPMEQAANDVANNAGQAAMDAAGVSDEIANLNKTANDAVNSTAQKAGQAANHAVNKTADAVTSSSSSSSLHNLGVGSTLVSFLVSFWL